MGSSPTMLVESGDLIPVLPDAVEIPWTKRKNHIFKFLHRGPVTFKTLVYDTNVGDISPLSTYFNPQKWTVRDLNEKFGHRENEKFGHRENGLDSYTQNADDEKSATLTPRLILFPELTTMSRPRMKSQGLKKMPYTSTPFKKGTTLKFPTVSVWSVPPPALITPSCDTSNLPSLSSRSPEEKSSSGEDNHDPIGPPKRRRLSAFEETYTSSLIFPTTSGLLKPRPASTSSPWTHTSDSLSPFISLELPSKYPGQVFHDDLEGSSDDDDKPNVVCNEQTLARSLRKIAKAFENELW